MILALPSACVVPLCKVLNLYKIKDKHLTDGSLLYDFINMAKVVISNKSENNLLFNKLCWKKKVILFRRKFGP